MRIDIITALPSLLHSPLSDSIMQRAQDKGIVNINIHDLRQYSEDKHKRIDDYAFGGGAGMVMRPEPLARCIESLKTGADYDEIIYMSPDGKRFDQKHANKLSTCRALMIICGHYKGIDERIRQRYVSMEISIGDFVLSGGELPAAVLTDAVVRLLPGVLNDETSALTDSFQDDLLAPPVYTRPAHFEGMDVPEILTSGNTPAIEQWRLEEAMRRTRERRPDLWKRFQGGGDGDENK